MVVPLSSFGNAELADSPAPTNPHGETHPLAAAVNRFESVVTALNTSFGTEIVNLRAEVSRLNQEVKRLQSATEQVPSSMARPPPYIAPPVAARASRTRVGMFTVAELERLGSENLLKLDAHMRTLAPMHTGFGAEFSRRMELMGLRGRPEYYTMTEAEIDARRDRPGNTVAEHSYWWAIGQAFEHKKVGGDYWTLDRLFFRFTMKEYFDWRGISETWME